MKRIETRINLSIVLTAALVTLIFAASEGVGATVSKSTAAATYTPGKKFKIDFRGTSLMPRGEGKATVENNKGRTRVSATVKRLEAPGKFGPFLTYVMWAVPADGRPRNLGEILPESSKVDLDVTTDLQAFALIITAEPYFAVTNPSSATVLDNILDDDSGPSTSVSTVKYDAIPPEDYRAMGLSVGPLDSDIPLALYQARAAYRTAQAAEAEKYAQDVFQKARVSLESAETAQASKRRSDRKGVPVSAREATQFAEEARIAALKAAEQEAKRLAIQQAKEAEDAASEEAALAAAAAQEEAAKREALRTQLLAQFNAILPTTDTPRGLQVDMGGDVLFDTAKYELRPEARERLARLAGIAAAYPGLEFRAEGHTDSTGGYEFNMKLSVDRAQSVRTYLISQGIPRDAIAAEGFGPNDPIADNSTADGRQKNRRVELIVGGEVIGTDITATGR